MTAKKDDDKISAKARASVMLSLRNIFLQKEELDDIRIIDDLINNINFICRKLTYDYS